MHASTRPDLGRALNAAAVITSISGAIFAGYGAFVAGFGGGASFGAGLMTGFAVLAMTGWIASLAAAPGPQARG